MLFSPRLYTVSPEASVGADFNSITKALMQCSNGDVVTVEAGHYSPSATGENFPLFVPPGVQLLGSGTDECYITDEDTLHLSNRPLEPSQSIVLLADRSLISGFTVQSSGGNGISHVEGAGFLIQNNRIRECGQHGVLLYGPRRASIRNNVFENNGTKEFRPHPTPIPFPCMQGHHVYFEGKAATANQVLIASNVMDTAFADGIAAAPVFDDPQDVHIDIRIEDNQIRNCGRGGIIICASYGSSQVRVNADIRYNTLEGNKQMGIDAEAVLPLIPRELKDVKLSFRVFNNTISGSPTGISNSTVIGPADAAVMETWIVANRISDFTDSGIELTGATCYPGFQAARNLMNAVVVNNTVDDVEKRSIVITGASLSKPPEGTMPTWAGLPANEPVVIENQVILDLRENSPAPESIVVAEGVEGNQVKKFLKTQAHT